MESKTDPCKKDQKDQIYNLWIKYTTKNDEVYFRQFILGFVQIWEDQLMIQFDDPPTSNTIKNDSGPHLSRLPDELLPAIGKFLIISKDKFQKLERIPTKELDDTTLLIKCLTVICRHFDNIQSIANYEYVSSVILIAVITIQSFLQANTLPNSHEIDYIKSFCHLIEVIYDPYLTWRNFVHKGHADYKRTGSNTVQLHVELIPFVYDCFQSDNILGLQDVGINLIHMLGAVISGSQNSLISHVSPRDDGRSFHGGNSHNGMRAICPATVSMLINLISKWHCDAALRKTSLKCYALMAIVLQRSSPVERQIDLVTICQSYVDAIHALVKTDHFLPKDGDDQESCHMDSNALTSIIDNVEMFLFDAQSKQQMFDYFAETNYFASISTIPNSVKGWNIDMQTLAISIVKSMYRLTSESNSAAAIQKLSRSIPILFSGLKSLGRPTQKLLKMCINLAYNEDRGELIYPEVMVKLLEWIKDMNDTEQIFLAESILNICADNLNCKSVVSKEKIIRTISHTLQHCSALNPKCAVDLIKLLEELGKFSITAMELKKVLWLLREEENFDYRKQLLQSLASISLHNMPHSTVCNEFLDIQIDTDGITVPDIRKWITSGAYGFIFHGWVKLYDTIAPNVNNNRSTENKCFRRIVLSLLSNQGTGFEVFVDNNGKLVVGVLTKKEFLATTASMHSILDNKWHLITVCVTPPKRPFSYSQINIFVDGHQKLGSTLKVGAFTERFSYCTIGCLFQRIGQQSQSSELKKYDEAASRSSSQSDSPKGMLPSFMERSFFPKIVSQAPSYFTLPNMRNTTSNDPNVKCYPIGMQDGVFGQPICLTGQLGCVVLAEPTTNVKTLLDAGANFASVIAQDIEPSDLTSKFVFCYSPSSCYDGLCLDLVPGNKYNGHVVAKYCKTTKIQDAINSIGGVNCLLPILETIIKSKENSQIFFGSASPEPKEILPSPSNEDFADWEVLASTTYTEWKMMQNPVSCFLCLIRYFINGHELNQEHLLNSDGIAILCTMLSKCNAYLFDVNVLMSVHLLLESIQNMSVPNVELLENWYSHLIFNFKIWSRAPFQITIGHIQYCNTMIKDDRKYFRKKFGIQATLDVIRQYYAVPDNVSSEDGKAIRLALLEIVKYYIQKELNIKEVGIIISYISSVKHEHLIIEILEMLLVSMNSKNCKDQIFLLMHEPQTAELLFSILTDKSYGRDLHESLLNFISGLLHTNKISKKHKLTLRLHDSSVSCQSLYPGLISHMMPLDLDEETIIQLLEFALFDDSSFGYGGALHLIHNLISADIHLKLEISKKMLTTTFNKLNSPFLIAKQIGWQESISRLLIKKQITNSYTKNEHILGKDIQNIPFEDNPEFLNQMDLMTFDEKTMELSPHEGNKEHNLTLTELQASVTEAANVIEHEIKEMAENVSGRVAGNISSVYSIIRQKTHDIHDTFESLAMGNDHHKMRSFPSMSTQSSNSTSEENVSVKSNVQQETLDFESLMANTNESLTQRSLNAIDQEEQLVYLVTNILFTVLWRGVDNNGGDSWKERGQVIACINLLGLNNELYSSHLTLRLKILEMGVQASLIDLSESGTQNVHHQQNAAQLLRMVYDLVVLDPNEDDMKKCSTKLLDGVLALLDVLMVFQQTAIDDWIEMSRLSFGLLLKCSHHPNPEIVAMATAKLHALLQNRTSQDPQELSYLIFNINKALNSAIEVGHSEQYSFLMPVMKALLEKSRTVLNLSVNVPDLPPTSAGPIFFHDFQMYSGSKQWTSFIDKKIKPLHDGYQSEVSSTLWEPLNTFWAECYEACKASSQKRAKQLMESRRKFQQKILVPWRLRQTDELTRLNSQSSGQKMQDNRIERRWKTMKRFLYGQRGAWCYDLPKEEFWRLSHHESASRMRLKLEPSLYPDTHIAASNLRDNTSNSNEVVSRRISTDFGTSITPAVIRDILTEDEVIMLEEEIRNSSEPQQQEIPIEKVVISQECDLVTLMTKVKGRLEVTSKQFSFVDLSPARDDGENNDFKFPMTQIKEVHLRKYNLRRSALEVFLIDQTSYFLNFTTKTRNKIFTKILSLQPPNILYGSGRSPSELLKASGLTQKWVNREISNFEYLMNLNTIAGRSYNDLSQYPVFPWILADYTSDVLDLTNPKSFRDLSKPIGVVNPKNEEEVRAKYDGFEDTSGGIPKFHYGTHYSNSAGVLHYLLRVEPFTSLHIDLQSGRFDVADRQFHSIPQTFKLLMDNPNDVKELIPEFFYFPEFLKNMNKFDLGILQVTKERVEDVILPPWANTPEDFINIHRRALESEYVSHNLHHWIDLIFGYKQKGPRAVEALNVFYYCSYEGAVDLDKISNPVEREAVEGMINNFGQTPSQLLREPHPRRLSQDETLSKLLRTELKRPDLTAFLDRIVNITCEFTNDKDPIIFLGTPRIPPRSFLQISPDVLVSISKSSILGCNSWVSQDKEKGFLLEIDATTTNLKNRKRLAGPFHPAINLHSQLFAVSLDGRHIYAGGIWDASLKVFNVSRGKNVASITRHLDVITCIALDNCGSYLVTGSKDCTCIVWSLITTGVNVPSNNSSTTSSLGQINTTNSLTPRPINTLYGHDDTIACVSIMTELDLVVSGSVDGTVNVYTIKEGQFVRTLLPIGCTGTTIEITFISISYQGHIAFSALDDKSHSVHSYSINGSHLGSKYVSGRVTGLTTASDFLVVADDAGDVTMSRLYGLKPVFDIPLHVPIQTVVVTPGNTHILAPLRDGKLAVIGISAPTSNKKHSVLNV